MGSEKDGPMTHATQSGQGQEVKDVKEYHGKSHWDQYGGCFVTIPTVSLAVLPPFDTN